MINVSWDDATKEYLPWLNRKTGKTYRLLTEAEWEYAARAGTTTTYSWGNDVGKNQANCNGCGSQWDSKQTAPVGSFKPNAFGLYDMHGNVWQWVQDCWLDKYQGAPTDGSAWVTSSTDSSRRVLRGGSWNYAPRNLRAANRSRDATGDRSGGVGFRLARTLSDPAERAEQQRREEEEAKRKADQEAQRQADPALRAYRPMDRPRAAARGETIQVQQGDTLYGIAKRYGVSISALIEVNGLETAPPSSRASSWCCRPDVRPPSRVAGAARRPRAAGAHAIPPPAPPRRGDAGWEGRHTMKAGESLYGIARQHGVSLAELQRVNGITEPTAVRAGTVLAVPGTALRAGGPLPAAGARPARRRRAARLIAPRAEAASGGRTRRSDAEPARRAAELRRRGGKFRWPAGARSSPPSASAPTAPTTTASTSPCRRAPTSTPPRAGASPTPATSSRATAIWC